MNDFLILIFQFLVFIFSVIVHEVSHGLMAERLGDDTAKTMGRLTLNPLKHLDFFGSLLLPFILVVTNSPIVFGWAKPVPYNPNNLRNPKTGAALIGLAGPLSNIAIAVIFAVFLRLSAGVLISSSPQLLLLFNIIIFINILLAIFNLVPIPPLDGSRLFFSFLPSEYYRVQSWLERYGMIILLFFLLFGFNLIIPIIVWLHNLLTGPYSNF